MTKGFPSPSQEYSLFYPASCNHGFHTNEEDAAWRSERILSGCDSDPAPQWGFHKYHQACCWQAKTRLLLSLFPWWSREPWAEVQWRPRRCDGGQEKLSQWTLFICICRTGLHSFVHRRKTALLHSSRPGQSMASVCLPYPFTHSNCDCFVQNLWLQTPLARCFSGVFAGSCFCLAVLQTTLPYTSGPRLPQASAS